MTYDSKVPLQLKRTQQWFASIITRPVDEENRINPISPTKKPMEEEAAYYIVPSPTLRPVQRIQIYNQQYWWRLLNTLQDVFPCVVRLFGYHDFNLKIGIPYLVKYPPRHWSLTFLGDYLPQWVKEDYREEDKTLVYDSVKVDWAFGRSFLAPQLAPIDTSNFSSDVGMSALLTKKLYLQPNVFLFEMNWDMFQFRTEFLKQEPEYWIDNDFPELPKDRKYFFVLYRNRKNDISWKEISEGEYRLLTLFQKGMTIEKACQWLEKQEGPLYDAAMKQLHLWFQEWTIRGWLSIDNGKK
jgi:Putative DNA-binding domain